MNVINDSLLYTRFYTQLTCCSYAIVVAEQYEHRLRSDGNVDPVLKLTMQSLHTQCCTAMTLTPWCSAAIGWYKLEARLAISQVTQCVSLAVLAITVADSCMFIP